MNWVEIIGLVAGILTVISLIPQLVRSWKTKSTKDVSLYTYIILAIGVLLWLIYGLLINDLPLILANFVSLVITIAIIALKVKYG